MNKYEVVFLCAIFAFALLLVWLLLNYQKPAEAKPVTTEIPEYIAKCSKPSFNRSSCVEFTIYHITRN